MDGEDGRPRTLPLSDVAALLALQLPLAVLPLQPAPAAGSAAAAAAGPGQQQQQGGAGAWEASQLLALLPAVEGLVRQLLEAKRAGLSYGTTYTPTSPYK